MATPIRIKVGCSLDSGWDKPFTQIEQRSKQAAAAVGRNMSRRGGKGAAQDDVAKQTAAAEKAATRVTQSESKRRLAAIRSEMRERARGHRDLEREVAAIQRREVREAAKAERDKTRAAKAEARKRNAEMERFARRTSHRTTRFMMPNAPVASMLRRGAMDMLHGAGVETSLGGIYGRVTSSDKAARELSVKGYIQGAEGSAGQRVDPEKLREEARALGEEMAMSTESILEGQSAFVDLRGNLAGARDISRDMAKLARSQGASYRDVMYMAGKAESMFASQAEYAGDELKKREAINSLLRTAVYEAKKYSIPLAEMAKEFPKLSGIAGQFEGDVGKNAVLLMGTAQLAEAGAAKNPATASTYAQNFGLALTKQSQKFKDIAGVNVFSDKEKNKLRSLDDIMVQTLLATEQTKSVRVRGKGKVEMNQLQQLSELMPNKRAFLAFQKYMDIFTEAGGGQKGAEAVRAEVQNLGRGVEQTQIDSDLKVALGGTGAKAEKFNQQLEKVVATMANELMPAMEQLAPKVLDLVKAFGGMVAWMARNPGLTISAAISASIARAGLESVLRSSIERAIMGTMGPGGAFATTGKAGAKPMSVAAAGGPLGLASAALTITATAVTLYAGGTMAIDWGLGMMGRAQSKQFGAEASLEADLQTARRFKRQGIDSTAVDARLEQQKADLAARIKEAEGRGAVVGPISPYTAAAGWAGSWSNLAALGKGVVGMEGGKTFSQVEQGRQDIGKLDELKQQMAQIEQALRGGLRINNLSDIPKPDMPPAGREPQ